eukprot:752921-Hanusia_phi.AAC.3
MYGMGRVGVLLNMQRGTGGWGWSPIGQRLMSAHGAGWGERESGRRNRRRRRRRRTPGAKENEYGAL